MADDSFAVASVQVGLLDDMVLGVHPVHAAASVVYGEAVGPEKVCVCNDAPVGSVHVGILDARCVAPVSPVDLPKEWRSISQLFERLGEKAVPLNRKKRAFVLHINHPLHLFCHGAT